MTRSVKIKIILLLMCISVLDANSQPVWVRGTPAVASTGPLSITMNYGIDRLGTVYIIVYNYNNLSIITPATVRRDAIAGPSGNIVATAVLSLKQADVGKTLNTILNVINPNQIHTIYLVAADSKSVLQTSSIRLNATTLQCPQANAGNGGDECDLNFKLNAVPVFGSGLWTKVSGPGNTTFSPNANNPGATVTVTAYGSYIFRWTETQGACKSSGDVIVNFYQLPTSNAGSGGNQCDLDFVLGAAPGPGGTIGTWTMTSGTGTATFIPDEHSPTATVTVSEYGTKAFTWTIANGPCSGSSSVSVNFYQQPVANAGPGANNCGRDYYMKAEPSVGTGTWTRISGPGNATFSPDSHTAAAKVTVSAFGTYVFRWTEVNGTCTSRASVTVGFFEQVSANAGNGGDECDKNFQLNAIPGNGIGTWSKISGPGIAVFNPNPNQYNAIVTVTQTGAYDFAWTEVNNNCSSVDIIRVVFHDPPSVSAGQDAAVCKGSSIRLQAEGTGTFLWSPSNLLDNPTLTNPVAIPTVTTIFTIRITDPWNCTNTDQVTIEVRDIPVAEAGPDQNLDYIFETELEANELKNQEVGEWLILDGTGIFSNKNDNNTNVSGLSLGENKFLWNVSNGVCSDAYDTVLIKINDLVLPTLITPNEDGRNDYFEIKGIETLGKTSINIFNRWGAMVYSDDDYSNNWDGKDYDGNPVREDTYYYVLKFGNRDPIKGYIVIKR